MGGDKIMFVGNVVSEYILAEGTGSLGAAFMVVSCAFLLVTAIFFFKLLGKLIGTCEGPWLNDRTLGRFGHLVLIALTYLFLWVPIVVLLVFSFNTEGFPSPWQAFTLKWYKELIHSVYLWKAFGNSLIDRDLPPPSSRFSSASF